MTVTAPPPLSQYLVFPLAVLLVCTYLALLSKLRTLTGNYHVWDRSWLCKQAWWPPSSVSVVLSPLLTHLQYWSFYVYDLIYPRLLAFEEMILASLYPAQVWCRTGVWYAWWLNVSRDALRFDRRFSTYIELDIFKKIKVIAFLYWVFNFVLGGTMLIFFFYRHDLSLLNDPIS